MEPEDRTEEIKRLAGTVEARSVAFTDLEVTKGGRRFDGYAAIYGEATDLGAYIETIVPPALEVGLRNTPNLPMVWDHNTGLPPFATTAAGTLRVEADKRGLRVGTDIDERHILGPTMMSMAERGELAGMSIGFITGPRDNKIGQRNGRMLRTITGFKRLLDVSPTWNPAYPGTTAELRSLAQMASVLVAEQVPSGESEQPGDGPDQEGTEPVQPSVEPEQLDEQVTCEHGTPTGDECEQCSEQHRAGVSLPELEAAARQRELEALAVKYGLPRT